MIVGFALRGALAEAELDMKASAKRRKYTRTLVEACPEPGAGTSGSL